MSDWSEDGQDELGVSDRRWPLAPTHLLPGERWLWWEQLWSDIIELRDRYRLRLAKGWWEDGVQVEALAALVAWVERYDCGELDDPPGKLSLLYDLERIGELFRGSEPFYPDRDHSAFVRFLIDVGCQPPPDAARRARGASGER